MKTTIKDIARLCGVSVTTVSRVLNNKTKSIGKDTVIKVQNKIDELGYRPNSIARSMITGKSHTIGLVIPDNSNPFFAELARRVEDIGFKKGYSVILCNTDNDEEKESAYINTLISRQIDGIAYISFGSSCDTTARLRKTSLPFVEVGHNIIGSKYGSVPIDYQNGGYIATKHLIKMGHKRIGCISGGHAFRHNEQRLDGFRQAMNEAGLEVRNDLIVAGDFRMDGGERVMNQLLELPKPPTAVFAFNDMMAFGAIRAVKSAGLSVPDDISIVGYDNTSFGQISDPSLTTVDHPVSKIAEIIMDMLFSNMNSGTESSDSFPSDVVIIPSLVQRDSTSVNKERQG